MPPSISDRLKALGMKVGAQELKPPTRRSSPERLLQDLGGALLETPLGEAYVIETRYPQNAEYPIGQSHGQACVRMSAPLDQVANWARDERIRLLNPESILFLDTETTGLSGGSGTYAFLIGAGRFEGDAFILRQFFMRDPLEEAAQLAALEAFAGPCQAIATFNGKAFDVPLLVTRFTAHGLRCPLLDLAHIDLLHLARRLWRDRLPSRTLPNLEAQILGSLRSEQDIPGWLIPEIYFTFLRDGDPAPIKNVLYHNAMDVVSLVALLDHMARLLNDPLTQGNRFGTDLIALAKLFEDLGDLDRATELYLLGLEHEDVRNQQMEAAVLLQALGRLASIRKRQNNYEAAVTLWQQAARFQHLESHIELAKCYEHRLNDLGLALHWTECAIELITMTSTAAGQNPLLKGDQKKPSAIELQHRLERLKRKMGGPA